ncbi:Uu.00g114660.m01.CDS01 [Anthostomella pinea]|uniref:Uu.00g114660.m01.CDS01 n=1 Tax=Anthostomella pinea TaxID=933095 RepID=A0AAI8VAI6_9PEZI|nr:Uu.00g114660.m01.CDS01 [Anthostomella pinea]
MVVSSMQHHPHHSQGPAPPQHLQHSRPSSIVHQQHHQAPPAPSQHPSAYSSTHSLQAYQSAAQAAQAGAHAPSAQHAQDLPYYAHQQSPYSTPGTTSGYTSAANPSADTSEMMAAAQMPRPYPPMSYHTPQSNSPASVASPSGHDQHRSIYGQPPSQLQHQSMYYGTQQPQYSSMPPQAPSPYQQHAQQPHQSMTSQPSMMMSQSGSQHQMAQQHNSQHAQPGMTGSPRHTKMEPQMPPQLQRPSSGPLGTPQTNQNGSGQLTTPTGPPTPGLNNNNAAPGPIPATTPLVVRQDGNGVQWIAFEYSRDRVKMEYTIRCDVESVNTDELSADFKTENCVYPRACCAKDQYRGNRLQYETECNTVGWALAQLNACLRGKRGLIQRAVDSWRNSNQDPRLRSRRVRRMAKMNNRKAVQSPHAAHMSGPSGPAGMSTPGAMGPSAGTPMGKPGMSNMGPSMHHHAHEGGAQGGGDEVGDDEYMDDDSHHHHHQAPSGPGSGNSDDVRPAHVFSGYPQQYPGHATSGSSMPPIHDGPHHGAIAARRQAKEEDDVSPDGLFPDIPEAKKRKFILVEDNKRGCRLRVRVTLESVDTKEIPDSFRKSSSVFPHSYFPREMQSPPPSATGSKFFQEDLSDDDGVEVDGGRTGRSRGHNTRERRMVKVPMSDGSEGEVGIPRTRKATRGKEVRLNDLGYRMAWLQSRVFSGRTIFLQRALDNYRNKTRQAIDNVMQDVKTAAPHYETRIGKRKWTERMGSGDKRDSS